MHEAAGLVGFQTTDPDDFAEQIKPVAPGIRVQSLRGTRSGIKVKVGSLPGLGLFRIQADNLQVRRPELPYIGITIPERGVIECVDGGRAEHYDASSAHVLAADRPFDLRVRKATPMLVANFDVDELRRYGERATGNKDSLGWSFGHRFVLTGPEGSSFRRILQFVWGEMKRDGLFSRSPHVRDEAANLLRESLLQLIASEAQSSQLTKHGDWLSLVRRAEDYIDANLRQSISTADLAVICGVSASTLQRGFLRRYGFGPHAFIKQRRLEGVRKDLRGADASSTVTDIASSYGFCHLSQFAADYRREFGELPSETLRAGRSKRV